MWPSSPAWAWASRASMVSNMPDSFSVRMALSRAVVSIAMVVALAAAARGEAGHDAVRSAPGRSGTTFGLRRTGRRGRTGTRPLRRLRPAGSLACCGRGGQDAVDGPVGRSPTAGLSRRQPRAGPVGACRPGAGRPGRAQPVEGVIFQQPAAFLYGSSRPTS
jgi:hypothetical protein